MFSVSSFVPPVTPIPEEWVHDAWIALLIATQSRVALVPEKLISYRIHSAQQIGVKQLRPSDDLLVKKWTALEERLAALPVDPKIRHTCPEETSVLSEQAGTETPKYCWPRLGSQ